MTITVDHDIPLPSERSCRRKAACRYLAVGESLITSSRSGVQIAYQVAARDPNYRFTTKKCEGGWRITRIK